MGDIHVIVLCNREHVDCSLLPCMHVCVCVSPPSSCCPHSRCLPSVLRPVMWSECVLLKKGPRGYPSEPICNHKLRHPPTLLSPSTTTTPCPPSTHLTTRSKRLRHHRRFQPHIPCPFHTTPNHQSIEALACTLREMFSLPLNEEHALQRVPVCSVPFCMWAPNVAWVTPFTEWEREREQRSRAPEDKRRGERARNT